QTGLFALDLGAALDPARAGTPGAAPRRRTDAESVDLLPGLLVPTHDGVVVAEQRRGAVVLQAVPTAEDRPVRDLLAGPVVTTGADATADGAVVVVAAARPESAGDVLVLRAHSEPLALTDLSAPLRATGRLRTPRELEATAPDGYPVHGWVATPDPARHAGPHPTVLLIHGGPYAQYTHALFDEVQTLTEAGYAVVLGNPRGSAGYGAAHGRAIRGAFGTVDTDDVLALLDHALADPALDLDADRVGVMGGSYGGYLTAWLTTRTRRFAAAIVERGFLDPVSFVGSADIGWFFGLEYLGDPATPEGAAAVAAQSPMAHVAAVATPTLVIHSENDWRCPVEQGQRWFVELRRRGVEAELLLFPGEGHELTRSGRPRHRVQRFEHVLAWWARHLPVR
ncbi:MAG: S9 family peptidase, partial [Actinotalea sp.]|nr:S9 family peptidase [Actinotalea sp.]